MLAHRTPYPQLDNNVIFVLCSECQRDDIRTGGSQRRSY